MRCVPLSLVVLAALTAPALANESVETGAFLPLSDTPATKANIAKTFGTYDASRDTAGVDLTVLALLTNQLQLQGVATITDDGVDQAVSAQTSIFEEADKGIDLQLALGWDRRGINEVQAAFAQLGAGRTIAGTYLLATARLDAGLSQGELGAAFDVAGVRQLGDSLYAGVDTRVEVDLERSGHEPMNESSWSLRAAPVATYAYTRFSVTASAGVAAAKPRDGGQETGVFAALGVGAAL